MFIQIRHFSGGCEDFLTRSSKTDPLPANCSSFRLLFKFFLNWVHRFFFSSSLPFLFHDSFSMAFAVWNVAVHVVFLGRHAPRWFRKREQSLSDVPRTVLCNSQGWPTSERFPLWLSRREGGATEDWHFRSSAAGSARAHWNPALLSPGACISSPVSSVTCIEGTPKRYIDGSSPGWGRPSSHLESPASLLTGWLVPFRERAGPPEPRQGSAAGEAYRTPGTVF